MINRRDFYYLLKFVFVFFLIYDIQFIFLPKITTARIAVIGLLSLYALQNNLKISQKMVYFLLFMLVLISFSFLQFLFSKDFTQISRLLWFSLYCVVVPFVFCKFTTNVKEFLWIMVICTFIQAVFTISSFLIPVFKKLIITFIVIESNQIETITYRGIGVSSISGAAFSVIQSCGVFSGLFLLKGAENKFQKIALVFLTFVCTLSALITGRLGLIISLLAIIAYVISELSVKNVFKYAFIFLIFSQVNYVSLFEKLTSKVAGFNVEYFLEWSGAALTITDNRSVNELTSMPIPPITTKTILGTGEVVDAKYGGNASGNDSGYIQTYYSLGLILAILFYGGYFAFLTNEIRKTHSRMLMLPVLIMFLVEYKEPFMFKYVLPFFILTLILQHQNDNKNNIVFTDSDK